MKTNNELVSAFILEVIKYTLAKRDGKITETEHHKNLAGHYHIAILARMKEEYNA